MRGGGGIVSSPGVGGSTTTYLFPWPTNDFNEQ